MTWARLDDVVTTHLKHLRISDGAFRLWTNALIYCNKHTTDGVIAKDLLPTLDHRRAWTPKQMEAFVAELVAIKTPFTVGLWIETDDAYVIHGYAEHQAEAMKDRVERKRAYERDRKAARRARGRDQETSMSHDMSRGTEAGQKRDMSHHCPSDTDEAVPSVSHGPDPTRPDLSLRESGMSHSPSKPIPLGERVEFGDVEMLFSELRKADGKGSYKRSGTSDYSKIEKVVTWANAEGATLAERKTALRESILGFLADTSDRVVAAKWNFGFFAADVGAYRAAYQSSHGTAVGHAASRLDVLRADLAKIDREHAECFGDANRKAALLERLQQARAAVRAAEREVA